VPAFVFATIFGYWLALSAFGFLISSIALVGLLGLTCTPRSRWPVVLTTGLLVTLMIWVLFVKVLGTALPQGTFTGG
jgi:hypothetical protein